MLSPISRLLAIGAVTATWRGPAGRAAAANASLAVDQHVPAPTTTNSRQRVISTPRLLPHTVQLCIHCRQNLAGFWVSRNSDQTVRRPWCLSRPGRQRPHRRPDLRRGVVRGA